MNKLGLFFLVNIQIFSVISTEIGESKKEDEIVGFYMPSIKTLGITERDVILFESGKKKKYCDINRFFQFLHDNDQDVENKANELLVRIDYPEDSIQFTKKGKTINLEDSGKIYKIAWLGSQEGGSSIFCRTPNGQSSQIEYDENDLLLKELNSNEISNQSSYKDIFNILQSCSFDCEIVLDEKGPVKKDIENKNSLEDSGKIKIKWLGSQEGGSSLFYVTPNGEKVSTGYLENELLLEELQSNKKLSDYLKEKILKTLEECAVDCEITLIDGNLIKKDIENKKN